MTAQDKQLHCHNCQPNSSCDMYVTRHRCSFKVWIILRIDVIEVYFGYFEHFMQAVIPYKKKGSLESNFQQFLINFAYFHTLYAWRIESLVESTSGMGPLLRNASITNNTHYWEESPITTLIIITEDCKSIKFTTS